MDFYPDVNEQEIDIFISGMIYLIKIRSRYVLLLFPTPLQFHSQIVSGKALYQAGVFVF